MLVPLVEQGAHAAEVGAGHHDVAALQGAALDQDGGDRAAAPIQLGLDDGAVGGAVRIGLQVHDLGLEEDTLDQVVQAHLLSRRDLDGLGFAAQAFHYDLVLQQFVDHLGRVGARLVDLVDRHDDRRAGSLGVLDGLDGLGHDAVVGGHHQHHDVGDVGAARPHGGERRVAGGVEEGHGLAVLQPHLIGADMLGDAAVFAGRNVGRAQGVQQRGLAVVDVTHDRHHGGARQQVIVDILVADEAFFHVGLGHAADRVAEFGGHQLGGVVVDDVVDLEHHALTHQELDDLHAAGRHPVGELRHGDDVGNDHFARGAGGFLAAALALLTLPLAGPANRGQRTHPLDGALIVPGHGLDGEAAFTALLGALDAGDSLVRRGRGLAARILVIVGPTRRVAATGPRGLAGGALDLRCGGRRVGRGASGRTGSAGTIPGTAGGAGRGTRRQGRIADGLAGRTRTVALRAVALRTRGAPVALRSGVALRRTLLIAALVGPRRALAEIGVLETAGRTLRTIGGGRGPVVAAFAGGLVGAGLAGRRSGGRGRTRSLGAGRGGRTRGGRSRCRCRRLGDGGRSLRGRGDGRGRFGRGDGGRSRGGFGDLVSGLGGGGGRSGLGAGALFAGLLLGGLAGLMLASQFDGALAGALLVGRQARSVARGRGRTWRGGRRRREGALLGRGRRGEITRRRGVGARALGLHDHRLGAAVAEALLHRARADRTGPTGLEGQGSSPAGGSAVVVLVAHALALTYGRDGPDQSSRIGLGARNRLRFRPPQKAFPRANSQE